MLCAVPALRSSVSAAPVAAARAIHVSALSLGRRKKDEPVADAKPKRALSKYNVFVKQTYPIVKAERSDLDQKQLLSEVARLWSLSPENPKSAKAQD